jgi:hypothetical protein
MRAKTRRAFQTKEHPMNKVETDPKKIAERLELTRQARQKHRPASREEAVRQILAHNRELPTAKSELPPIQPPTPEMVERMERALKNSRPTYEKVLEQTRNSLKGRQPSNPGNASPLER